MKGVRASLVVAGGKPRSGKAQGGYRRGNLAKPQARCRDLAGVGVPGGATSILRGRGETQRGARRPRGRTAPGEDQGLEGWNPIGGTGMEQAREVVRGARRREGEKP
jgi:hypothetical protein